MRTGNKLKNKKNYLKKIKNKFIEELILKIYRLELLIKVKIDLLDFILKKNRKLRIYINYRQLNSIIKKD